MRCFSLFALLGLVGCGPGPGDVIQALSLPMGGGQPASGYAVFKFFYAPLDGSAPDAAPLINGKRVQVEGGELVSLVPGTGFGAQIPAGTYTFSVQGSAVTVGGVVPPLGHASVLVYDGAPAVQLKFFENDFTPRTDKKLAIRVVNVGSNRQPMSVTYTATYGSPATTIATDVAFGEVTEATVSAPTTQGGVGFVAPDGTPMSTFPVQPDWSLIGFYGLYVYPPNAGGGLFTDGFGSALFN